jgi:hypothetical protein
MGKGARALVLIGVVAVILLLLLPGVRIQTWIENGRTDYPAIAFVVAFFVVAIGVLWIGRSED